jgi:hypothetical protein
MNDPVYPGNIKILFWNLTGSFPDLTPPGLCFIKHQWLNYGTCFEVK